MVSKSKESEISVYLRGADADRPFRKTPDPIGPDHAGARDAFERLVNKATYYTSHIKRLLFALHGSLDENNDLFYDKLRILTLLALELKDLRSLKRERVEDVLNGIGNRILELRTEILSEDRKRAAMKAATKKKE